MTVVDLLSWTMSTICHTIIDKHEDKMKCKKIVADLLCKAENHMIDFLLGDIREFEMKYTHYVKNINEIKRIRLACVQKKYTVRFSQMILSEGLFVLYMKYFYDEYKIALGKELPYDVKEEQVFGSMMERHVFVMKILFETILDHAYSL